MIQFEQEVCDFLAIPSIPKKKWDGQSSFRDGVAVTNLAQDRKAYAICTFDADVDKEPRIKKIFAFETFFGIEDIFVVPAYMDTDVEHMDLDDASKEAADRLVQETNEIIAEETHEEPQEEKEENPFYFEEIHNIEEARAWLQSYNSNHGIKGRVPSDENTIKLRLLTIYTEQQQQQKKNNKKSKKHHG